ncbi:cytochrome c-550 PedF [Azospirillum thermophilum]|uniref:Cytochrome c-550 PedF n=1 Tax=Azospirillum thermophilum TaxID=2202148 RepID=A0A2S2CYZ0_9PROT|nr:cytochrome c-550 PedF [Azospirillum thermophilum]AWK89699.1 cytochrome c-550 PedF [Azospirillum thermophilum]
MNTLSPTRLTTSPLRTLALAGLALGSILAVSATLSTPVRAHGDVTPQAVDTSGLEKLGDKWRDANPYRGNPRAIEIGASAFNQNCARCHGLGAVSGGIAPDLRYLEPGDGGDEWFKERVINGSVRNGVTYMPQFGDALGQEALWAIRSWLETVHAD